MNQKKKKKNIKHFLNFFTFFKRWYQLVPNNFFKNISTE